MSESNKPRNLTPDQWMQRAIRLSQKGFPAPNPHVGCVLVREGELVGEGFHARVGGPHAEVLALTQAGPKAKGSTAFVTLEPCNHHGRTGPCSQALIEAGVARVEFAVADPDPRAKGGAQTLREAGIEVASGRLEAEARSANEVFLFAQENRRPWVTVKAAIGLDGRIALPDGRSQWITGPKARAQGRRLRAELGAVMVGAGTVRMDNPELTSRLRGASHLPVKVVLDPRGTLEPSVPALKPPSIHLTHRELESFSPDDVLAFLFEKGIHGLLIEGGATTASPFLAAGLVDQIELFVSPRLLGNGLTWVNAAFPEALHPVPSWRYHRVRRLGDDLWLSLRPNVSDRPPV
jgi:diaminohydroxyphosphoribosylaminopyrimidine deaminase / 5-amino-6-(5-phosphoribosylamino)uracil reductase